MCIIYTPGTVPTSIKQLFTHRLNKHTGFPFGALHPGVILTMMIPPGMRTIWNYTHSMYSTEASIDMT